MPNALFLIAGGGTGAKVAEALLHLCAAGLAPKEVHLLLVDADSTNGNLKRTLATAEVYQKMQQWPWSVQTTTGGRFFGIGKKDTHRLELFASELHVHEITTPLDSAEEGGIGTLAQTPNSRLVLDLLYDADEQTTKAHDGFRARPNLGCLLLAEHLEKHIESSARRFLDALVRHAQGGAEPVPVVVAASIFGGTGASLLPVARGAIEKALNERAGGSNPAVQRLRWAASMVLPHYQPTKRQQSVDPDRYLLDTANALQFYGLAQASSGELFDAVYAIGSDRPARNRVTPRLGQQDQANAPYVEELVAALGAVDFAERPARGSAVRVYHPDRGQDRLRWADLPLGGGERLAERFGYLLHLGAFFLRPADPFHPGLSKGLAGLIDVQTEAEARDIEQFAWFKHVLHPWAQALNVAGYAQAPVGQRIDALRSPNVLGRQAMDELRPAAVEYLARVHLWAALALRDGGDGALHLITHLPDQDYTYLQGEMSRMDARDVDAPAPGAEAVDPARDNALARLLRTALAAEVNAHERNRASEGVVAGDFSLIEPGDGRIGLRVTVQQIEDALRHNGLGTLSDEYTRTVPRAATAAV